MKKDAYYFSHDANAFSDPKIQKLMMKHGLKGYAFYFICIEMMRNQKDYKIDNDSDMIAYSMRIEEPLVKLMITECLTLGLFISDSGKLFSDSFLRRMKLADDIRNKRVENGKKGGRPKKQEPQVKLSLSKTKAIKGKEKKVKESKVKEDRAKEFATNTKKLITEKKIQISESEANNFIEYWCETGINDLKLRFEKERTFGLSRRLSTWMNNNFSSNNTNQQQGEPKLQFYKGCE